MRICDQAKAAAELQELQEIWAGNIALASAEIAARERACAEASAASEVARLKVDAALCEARRTIEELEAAAAALMADAVLVSPPSSPASSSSSEGSNVAALAAKFAARGGGVLAPSPLDLCAVDTQRQVGLMLAVAAEDEAKVRELVQVYGVDPRAANHGFCGRYTGMSPYDLAYSKTSSMFTSVYNRMLDIMDGKQ